MLRNFAALTLVFFSLAARAEDYDDDDGRNDSRDEQQQGPSVDDFRSDPALSSNGEWIDTPEYGTVWRPANVDANWQPYYAGRWQSTTAGWAWMSDEPFGWAVYHYGRWAYEQDAGWVWLPGSVWAPAWVSWRWGDGYAGWCPLGPRNVYYEQPHNWVFVEQRHFLQPVPHYAVPIAQGARVWAAPVRGPQAGPVVRAVEQQTGHGVRPLQIADAPRAQKAGPAAPGGAASFYRPRSVPVGQVGAPYMRASPAQVQPQRPAWPSQGQQQRPSQGQQQRPSQGQSPRPSAQPGQRPAQVAPRQDSQRASPPTSRPATAPAPAPAPATPHARPPN